MNVFNLRRNCPLIILRNRAANVRTNHPNLQLIPVPSQIDQGCLISHARLQGTNGCAGVGDVCSVAPKISAWQWVFGLIWLGREAEAEP